MSRKQPTPPLADAIKPDPPPAPPPRMLLGLPVVEVDDMPEGEIRLVPSVEILPLRVRPAVAASPTDPVRFIAEFKVCRPGRTTMEETRDG